MPTNVPSPRAPRRALLAALLLLLPAALLANQKTQRFWLQNTITREAFGPIVRQTGYRFQIKSESFVVLESAPGKIRVATYPGGKPFGPYDIAPGHILDLGTYAFSIINVQSVEVPDLPPDLRDLTGLDIQGESARKPAPQKQQLERRDIPMEEWPLRVGAWLEPSRKAKYDWTVGGYAGKKALNLESRRFGVRAEWGNAFLQAGLILDSKQSGSLTPAVVSLDHLTLSGGSGFGVSGGWLQPFILDENWDLLAGAAFEWTSESYDLTAQALVRTEKKVEPEADAAEGADTGATEEVVYSYEYRSVSSSLDLSERFLSAIAGVEYHDAIWGGRALLRADLFSDISTSGSVHINDASLSVSGDRTHPIVVEFGAWCYVLDPLRIDLTAQLGSIQSIRLAAYWEF